MRLFITKIAVLFGIIFLLAGCIKKKEFDVVPSLTFLNYEVFSHQEGNITKPDSAHLTFSFTDGDGDLGSNNNEDPTVFVQYYEDEGSGFVKKEKYDTIYFPKLNPQGNGKGVEGTYVHFFDFPFFNYNNSFPYQRRIYMVDQAGHQSNVIQTPSQSK